MPDLLVDIIKSFHAEARIRVNGELSEEIQVDSGLRQGVQWPHSVQLVC